ncbi:MAG: hypothetical protein AB7O68_16985 [Pirellulales bacterium]
MFDERPARDTPVLVRALLASASAVLDLPRLSAYVRISFPNPRMTMHEKNTITDDRCPELEFVYDAETIQITYLPLKSCTILHRPLFTSQSAFISGYIAAYLEWKKGIDISKWRADGSPHEVSEVEHVA